MPQMTFHKIRRSISPALNVLNAEHKCFRYAIRITILQVHNSYSGAAELYVLVVEALYKRQGA